MRYGPAALAAAAVLLLHGLLAWRVPVPGAFLKYTLAAEQVLAGSLPAERLLDFSPLYLWLAVAAQRLTASFASSSASAVLGVLQLVLVAAAAAFAYAIFRQRFPAWLAAAAVAVFAVDRHVLVYERILEPEAVLLFSLLGFLWAVGRRSTWTAGVFAALCLATRPTFLPVFVLVPLALWLDPDNKDWRRRALLFSVPVLLALLGLMARTTALTGDPRTPVMNPGTVFFEGNNPLSQGVMARYPPTVLTLMGRDQSPDSGHAVYRRVARAATGEELSIREVNAYWSGLAWAHVRAEPLAALGRVRDKLQLAFHGYRWHDISLAWQLDRALPPLSVPFAFVAALALPGFLLELRRLRERDVLRLCLYLVAFAQLGVMLVFYVSARHRVVLLPVLLYFAAAAVEYLRSADRKWPAAVLAAVLAVVLLIPDDKMRDEEYQRDGHTALSVLLPELRQRTRAEPLGWHADLATEALASAPFWLDDMRPVFFPQDDATLEERLAAVLAQRRDGFSVDFDLGIVLLEAGRPAEAAEVFEGLVGREPSRGSRQASAPLFYLGRATVLSGQRERGLEMLEDALGRWPGHPYVLAELRVLTSDERYGEELSAAMGELDARYLLAQAFLVHGRPAEAAAAFAFVAQRLPELREAGIGLAVALGQQGQVDEAAERYLAVAYERPQPLLHSREIAEIFRRWAAAHPDARTRFVAGRVLFQHGRYREALELLRGLDDPRASAEAARIERAGAGLRESRGAL